ncbi:MAG: EAL domain-containing protein [Rhodospirillaceae bacterium]
MHGPLLDSLGIGIIVLDVGERVIGWNEWVVAMSRIPAATARGQRLDVLFPELDEDSRLIRAVREALTENMASVVNSVFNRSPLPLVNARRGERIPQNIVVRPLEDDANGRVCLIQIFDLSTASQRERALENQVRLRTQAEQALRLSEARLKDAQRLARLGNWLWLPQARSFWWSEQCAATFGAGFDRRPSGLDGFLAFVDPADRAEIAAALERALEVGGSENSLVLEHGIRTAAGERRHVRSVVEVLRDERGAPVSLHGTVQDVTELEHRDAQLRLAARVFETSPDAIIITDARRRILSVNQAFCAVMGYSAAEVAGKRSAMLSSGRHEFGLTSQLWRAVLRVGLWRGELWARRQSGEVFPTWNSLTKVCDGTGRVINYIGIFSDLTETKIAAERIEFLSRYDQLTGLPNRMLLEDYFAVARAAADRGGHRLALMGFDLDNFKQINDTLGHGAGDFVLREVAERLRAGIGAEDTISRHGGDEFLILHAGVSTGAAGRLEVDVLLARLAQPIRLGEHRVSVAASVGISLYPDDGSSFEVLFRKADTAVFEAKRRGRNAAAYFTAAMTDDSIERLVLHADLRQALGRQEFSLHYQPFVDFATGRIVGGEALLRWTNPDHGSVPPGRFIPIAEESGLIVPIGKWVLREVCRQNRQWRAEGGPELCLAVNVSALQLRAEGFVEMVAETLAENRLPPEALEIELTESVLISEADRMMEVVDRLKALGVRLSIDDFGTGYSSLAYLKRLKVDKLKLDRSFVSNITVSEDGGAIVIAILQMAETLRLTTIAEGVETIEQAEFLKAHGCRECQGYLFSRPVPAEQFAILVASERARRARVSRA